jgi:Domain of unknown function (DUF4132)/Family of unknown function (DUF5724)
MSDRALFELKAMLGAAAADAALWRDIRRFEAAALPAINAAWNLAELDYREMWTVIHPGDEAGRALYRQRCDEVRRAIRASLGDEIMSRCAAAFLLHPQLWQPAYGRERVYPHGYQASVQAQVLRELAADHLRQKPPHDWVARVSQRLMTLCTAMDTGGPPDLGDCVGFLLAEGESAAALLDALTAGDWEAAWRHTIVLAGTMPPIDSHLPDDLPRPILDRWFDIGMAERLHILWQECGAQRIIALLWRLYHQGRLDPPAFRRLLETLPNSLSLVNNTLMRHANGSQLEQPLVVLAGSVDWSILLCDESSADRRELAGRDDEPDAFMAELQRLVDAVLWEMLCDFRPEAWPGLGQIRYLSGGRYLLRLAEEVDQRGLAQLAGRWHASAYLTALLAQLLSVLQRRDDDDSARLVSLLRQLSATTLLAILPHARPYEVEICAALGWEGSAELVALLHGWQTEDLTYSANPAAGVVRREDALRIVAPMEEAHVRMLLDAFADQLVSAVALVRATLGWNRKELRRMLGRRSQLAARALPLLPLEQPDELLQRYLMLTKYEREAGSSRAGRKAYERAAAQAGLTNLALHAGYADATRLEWAMEDQLGTQVTTFGRQWEIEGYRLTLSLRAGRPAIDIRNSKRALKRMPAVVTRDYAYREVRAALDQAQDQERRYRQTFLDAMRRGQPLNSDELALLRRNPLAAGLLERLVLMDEAGACGLFCADDGALVGCRGERVRISGAVTVVHPYTLMQMGLLADWQAEIVRQQLVQPFRQIFRELYLVTPAELEAGYESGRLAGRRLKNQQALAVLANLGWLIDDYSTVYKPFYDLGYAAHFETGGYGYGDDSATSGSLSFWPLEQRYRPGTDERRIPLASVPPLVFTEVLRDLDMVTVIAHESEERGTSREVIQQRADLLRATTVALGLAQVRVEEPLVHVRGSLMSYRIHLATGAIYMESGRYLCIVPSPRARKAVYLPFEEGGEPIVSEIVSKVIMLANDAQIGDSTILTQIAPMRQAA